MKTFKQYLLNEVYGQSKAYGLVFSKTHRLPIFPKMMKKYFGNEEVVSYHVCGHDALKNLIKLEGTKKGVSTTTTLLKNVIERGVASEGGYVVVLKGNPLLKSITDLTSSVDFSGRRWIDMSKLFPSGPEYAKIANIIQKKKLELFKEYNQKVKGKFTPDNTFILYALGDSSLLFNTMKYRGDDGTFGNMYDLNQLITIIKSPEGFITTDSFKVEQIKVEEKLGKKFSKDKEFKKFINNFLSYSIKEYINFIEKLYIDYKDFFVSGFSQDLKNKKNIISSGNWTEIILNNVKIETIYVLFYDLKNISKSLDFESALAQLIFEQYETHILHYFENKYNQKYDTRIFELYQGVEKEFNNNIPPDNLGIKVSKSFDYTKYLKQFKEKLEY